MCDATVDAIFDKDRSQKNNKQFIKKNIKGKKGCLTFSSKINFMTTQEIANRMAELFKENKWMEVQDKLFAENAVSIEPPHSQGLKTVEGLAAIKQKGEQFNSMVEEMHGGWVSDLIVAGNYITCGMGMDATMKGSGRMKMEEVCVYEVKDGKIVKEQFFF